MGLTLGLRLTNQPRPFCVHGLRSSPRREVFPSADGPGWFPPGGLFVTPARRSQADAARAALPLYAARAAQPPLHLTGLGPVTQTPQVTDLYFGSVFRPDPGIGAGLPGR